MTAMNTGCNELLRSLDEISDKFGVGKNTIRKWIKQGAPIYKAGRGYKALFTELFEWIKTSSANH